MDEGLNLFLFDGSLAPIVKTIIGIVALGYPPAGFALLIREGVWRIAKDGLGQEFSHLLQRRAGLADQ